jgi:hypothetical protein
MLSLQNLICRKINSTRVPPCNTLFIEKFTQLDMLIQYIHICEYVYRRPVLQVRKAFSQNQEKDMQGVPLQYRFFVYKSLIHIC